MRIPLIELNREVARETGLPAGEVMALYGIAARRRIEQRVLDEQLAAQYQELIAKLDESLSDTPGVPQRPYGPNMNCAPLASATQPQEHGAPPKQT